MERIWAPWRIEYVVSAGKGECPFCVAARGEAPDWAVLLEAEHAFIMTNAYPYNSGHLMVAPYRHVGRLEELTSEELYAIAELTRVCIVAIEKVMRAQGFNVGLNLGQVAGAGVAGHLHVHVVPRWAGDTNFMSVIADTRVVPEALQAAAQRLRPALQEAARQFKIAPRQGSGEGKRS